MQKAADGDRVSVLRKALTELSIHEDRGARISIGAGGIASTTGRIHVCNFPFVSDSIHPCKTERTIHVPRITGMMAQAGRAQSIRMR
jgi:hypothetical protein